MRARGRVSAMRAAAAAAAGVCVLLGVATSAAGAQLAAVSAGAHFGCVRDVAACEALRSPASADAPAALAAALVGRAASDPIVRTLADAPAPEIVVAVRASLDPAARPVDVAAAIARALGLANGEGSTLAAELDAAPAESARVEDGARIVSVDELVAMPDNAAERAFGNGKPDLLSVSVDNYVSQDMVMGVLGKLKERASGRMAVLWTFARAADANATSAQESPKPADSAAANATAGSNSTEATNTTAVAPGFNANGTLKKTTTMDPPQISVGGVAGLAVALVLLTILVPGLICLYKIESPQTFDAMDKDDGKKKMQ